MTFKTIDTWHTTKETLVVNAINPGDVVICEQCYSMVMAGDCTNHKTNHTMDDQYNNNIVEKITLLKQDIKEICLRLVELEYKTHPLDKIAGVAVGIE